MITAHLTGSVMNAQKMRYISFILLLLLLLLLLNGSIRKVIMLKVKFEDLRFFYCQAILVFIENSQNTVQRSLYLENSYENTITGTAITTITATITSTTATTTSTTTITTTK